MLAPSLGHLTVNAFRLVERGLSRTSSLDASLSSTWMSLFGSHDWHHGWVYIEAEAKQLLRHRTISHRPASLLRGDVERTLT